MGKEPEYTEAEIQLQELSSKFPDAPHGAGIFHRPCVKREGGLE